MKKLLLLFVAVSFAFAGNAQNLSADQVPAVVKKNFTAHFPNANPDWSQDTPGFVNATFSQDKHKVIALFIMTGDLITTDTYLKEAEFPPAALTWVKSNLTGGKISSMDKSVTDKGTKYESVVKTKDGIYDLTFDADGNFLNKGKERNDR